MDKGGQLIEEIGHNAVEQRRPERSHNNLTLAESDFLLSKLLHAVKEVDRKERNRYKTELTAENIIANPPSCCSGLTAKLIYGLSYL